MNTFLNAQEINMYFAAVRINEYLSLLQPLGFRILSYPAVSGHSFCDQQTSNENVS